MAKDHDPKTCLRCALIRAIEAKYPGWPNIDNADADEDIMETLVSFSGYMLATMEEEAKSTFILELGLRTARYEGVIKALAEKWKHIH